MVKITITDGSFSVTIDTMEEVIKLHDAHCEDDEWIDWVWSDEKPYPETLDTLVSVRHSDGSETDGCDVEWWKNGMGVNNWHESIVSYRVVK